jgi:hypothetical protein
MRPMRGKAAAEALEWLGAEGQKNGLPFMVRMRNVPRGHPLRRPYPHLLVTTRNVESPGDSRLPSREQYAALEKYEERVLDALEEARLGILAFVRAHNGTVEHFLYVADPVDAAAFLIGRNVLLEDIALDAIEGDDWYEYDRTRAGLTFE